MKPLISVKIPTYNCAVYLKETLDSIFNQVDFNLDLLDIEVVDDCSTKDDPEEVVRLYGRGKVKFYRQSKNVGATRNFNICVGRADCDWVHILHGDDFLHPKFYFKVQESILKFNNDIGIIITQATTVNEIGQFINITPSIQSLILPSNDVSELIYHNPIRTPAVVVKRDTYFRIGKFDESFCHVADWDMWVRAVYCCKGLFINEQLTYYRYFQGNDTNRVVKEGLQVSDYVRLYDKFQKFGFDINQKKVDELVKEMIKSNLLSFLRNDISHSSYNYFLLSLKYLNVKDLFKSFFKIQYKIYFKRFKKKAKVVFSWS